MAKVVFIENGERKEIEAKDGLSILEVAHQNNISLEGACEGSLACSTCHVIVKEQSTFDKLGEATEEEEDMLDLAFGVTLTSRLGCQIIVSDEIDGIELVVPSETRNITNG